MNEPQGRARSDSAARYLGFDFGTTSIGVAVGNGLTRTASPCGAIPARDGRPDWAALDPLLDTWKPAALIIGLPLHMDASESPMSTAARRFSRRLAARYHLPAFMVDERLSSRAADGGLDEPGRKTLSKAQHDSAAACLILETWLRECRD